MQKQHEWKFFRAGEVDQVSIRTGADIANIGQLDQKLWVALACPTRGIEFDSATLDLIDSDADGRIRAPELVAACEWAVSMVRNPDVLVQASDVLRIDSINDATEEGLALADEARRLLALDGREGGDSVTLADVLARLASLNAMPFNGDGVLNPLTLEASPELIALASRIMDSHGSVTGCDGQPGLGRAQLDHFFADVQAIASWHAQAPQGACSLPSQELAVAAAKALNAVQVKVEDFFARAHLSAFDAKAQEALSPTAEGYAALSMQALTQQDAAIAALPLAQFTPEGALPLRRGINPAWAQTMEAFRQAVVLPLLGDVDSLHMAQWNDLKAQLSECQAWLAAYPQTPLGDLGMPEAQLLLESGQQEQLLQLIALDEAEHQHSQHVLVLEKLIRFQRDLWVLLNNFVNFAHFYGRDGATFQAGTLYLDGRSCDLTVDVTDPGAHAALAGMAKVYLAYCECRRNGQKRHIVAAFTAGDVDFLFVGRNGIFYDRDGNDWDASITKLIENPTSIGQAFFSPYKKFVRMIEEQVAKRAAAKNESVTTSLNAKAGQLTELSAAPTAPAPAAAPAARKTDVGTVAAIGVAMGSISAMLVAIFGKFIELGPWIPVALLGLILAISGPSMLIAWLKLRERSLGPILDASGWAINGRMKINVPLGNSLSQTAKVPLRAKRALHDPYAVNHTKRWLWVLVAVVLVALAWSAGWLDKMLPVSVQSTTLLHPSHAEVVVAEPVPAAAAPEAPVP